MNDVEKLFYIIEVSSPDLAQINHDLSKYFDGVEEYSFDEAQIDLDLGKDAFVGAELNLDLIKKMEDKQKNPSFKFFFYGEGAYDRMEAFSKELKNYQVDEVYLIEELERDWNEEWRKDYKEIPLNLGWKIVPSWYKVSDLNSHHKNIYIYPGMGFGTGTHPTTFNCLKIYLEHSKLPPKAKVLDFGCGSGILGIAALKKDLLAEVSFCDVDKLALDNCVQNLAINFEGEDLSQVSVISRERYKTIQHDLVFANILLNILVAEKEIISQSVKKGGELILSGLTPEQEEEVLGHYQALGFQLAQKVTDEGWLALRLIKR